MKSYFSIWIALAILGCRSDSKDQGSCVKTAIETLSAEEALDLRENSAFGGYAVFRENSEDGNTIEKVCTQTLLTNFEKLANGEIGTFVTSRHCLDWFLVNHNNAEIIVLDPSPEIGDHRIGIELVNNRLEELSKFKHLRKTAAGEEVARLISNLAFESCLGGQYALQFNKNDQKQHLDMYFKNKILKDESIVLDQSKIDSAIGIFDGVPCYSYLDAQIINFRVKQDDLVKIKYLATRFKDSSQDFDAEIIEKRESEWLQMAISVMGYLTYRDGNEEHIDKFETELKVFANYQAFRDSVLFQKSSLSDADHKAQIDFKYRNIIYNFLKDSEKQWSDHFTGHVAKVIAEDNGIHVMAHTNGTIKDLNGNQSKLEFLNIVFWDLIDIIKHAWPKRVTKDKYGGFMLGLNLFYRNDAHKKDREDNFKINYWASDSGTLISVDKIPIVTLTAVGDQPVVKASGRLDLGRDIKPADVDFYKKQIQEQERAAAAEETGTGKTETEDVSSSDRDPNETISETQDRRNEQNNAKRDESPSFDSPTQVNSRSPILANEASNNSVCR